MQVRNQVSSDVAMSLRWMHDAGVGQGTPGQRNWADHGAIGSPDEPVRMCASVPLGSIDESMSAISGIIDGPNKIKTRAENQTRFYELATE